MTNKISKRIIITVTILVIVVLMISRAYVQNETKKSNYMLSDFNARKQDLILQQKQLQEIIFELNNTLQADIKEQSQLSEQLASLTGQSASQSSGSSSSTSKSQTPPSNTPSAPVTRAS